MNWWLNALIKGLLFKFLVELPNNTVLTFLFDFKFENAVSSLLFYLSFFIEVRIPFLIFVLFYTT